MADAGLRPPTNVLIVGVGGQGVIMVSKVLAALCQRLGEDLQRKGYAGRTVGIKLRYADFHTVTRDVTLPAAVADALAIRRAAGECLRRVPLEQKLRLLGVRVSGLEKTAAMNMTTRPIQANLPLA